jgi:hypothetical protein
MSPTRRQVLKWGLGGLAGAGVAGFAGGVAFTPPRPSSNLPATSDLAVALFEQLTADGQTECIFEYDHPLRQYHNRGVDTGGGWAFFLGRGARQTLVDLVHAGLSEHGRQRLPSQFFWNWPGVHVTRLAIFGDPRKPPFQILVTGPHLNLRLGGRNREGVAFGGPQVYGDQRGNGEVGLPGNAYRDQLQRGQALFSQLSPAQRSAARQPTAPVQTDVTLQGAGGSFDGIAVADLAAAQRASARDVVASILDTYEEEDVAYAWQCIEHNGGVDALRLADYSVDHQGGRDVGDGASQIFRLEGPAAVFYYRGEPHLHALFNVGMDGENPLSVGAVVGQNPVSLDRAGVKALFERALLAQTGADLAYYHELSVAGRLRAGTIRTGDIYNLESWRERVRVVEVRGADLSPGLSRQFAERGDAVRPQSRYKVATTSYVADELSDERLGSVQSDETGEMLRDVTIAHLQAQGFGA